jgi:hypothetical protein
VKNADPMLYDPGKRQPHKSREYADGKRKRGIVYQKEGDGNGVNKDGLPSSIKKKGIEFVFWPALVENYPIGTALIKFKVEETGSLIYTYEILDLVILM